MGCDIHMWIEYRTEHDTWEALAEVFPGRNYTLFALMAGVRDGGGIVLWKPRGIAQEMDIRTSADFDDWIDDAHHESWLTHSEFEGVVSRFEAITGGKVAALTAINQMMYHVPHARVVFWFDN